MLRASTVLYCVVFQRNWRLQLPLAHFWVSARQPAGASGPHMENRHCHGSASSDTEIVGGAFFMRRVSLRAIAPSHRLRRAAASVERSGDHLALVVDRAPEVHRLATDPDHDLVEMPT
jgi:hypothetical protein